MEPAIKRQRSEYARVHRCMSFRGLYSTCMRFCSSGATIVWRVRGSLLVPAPCQTGNAAASNPSTSAYRPLSSRGGMWGICTGRRQVEQHPSVAVLVLHRRLLGRLRVNLNRSHGAQRRKRDGLQAGHGCEAHGCEAHGCGGTWFEAGARCCSAGKQRRIAARQQTRQTRGLQADPSPAVSASARDTAGQHACCGRLPQPASAALLAALTATHTRRAPLGVHARCG